MGNQIVNQLPDYVTIGSNTYAADLAFSRWGKETISIGKYCSISQQVKFLAGGNHRTDCVSTYPFDTIITGTARAAVEDRSYAPDQTGIKIGNDVWVGFGASFIGSCEVGDGAVISAGAVVFSGIPAYAIAVGNPARVMKYRFSDHIIHMLLEIKWWDWSDELVKERIDEFYSETIVFCNRYAPAHTEVLV